LRIERARELLSDGSLTVAEVAYASGFENIGYFCRYYRRITGEAPGDTKKRYTVGDFSEA
jgi:transcriptional regulator GlxA family with amidase domain